MNTPLYWKKEAKRLSSISNWQSLFALGNYHLLINNGTDCINTYSRALASIPVELPSTKFEIIISEIAFLDEVQKTNPWLVLNMKLFFNLALYLISDSQDKHPYKNYIDQYRIHKEPFKTPVLIVAGGASLMDKTKTETYRNYFREIMRGFKGTVISGGTNAGIPGLVGEVKAELEKHSKLGFTLIAYLPKELPPNAEKSIIYDSFQKTESNHFSVLEILCYWSDLIGNGINPADVILLGIEGGNIASMEYRIALSIGAKVNIVANSGRAASELLEDKFWKSHRNLNELMSY